MAKKFVVREALFEVVSEKSASNPDLTESKLELVAVGKRLITGATVGNFRETKWVPFGTPGFEPGDLKDADINGEAPHPVHEGEWGHLPNEPCRFCHFVGKVYFLIDEGPEGKSGLSPTRCDHCGRSWVPDSSTA